ncbi:MAG: hypothetical protein M3O61_03330 [Gemmatimonadota bacterium]|nr:hypothetical protein [Gemmatimonadota bacterium]
MDTAWVGVIGALGGVIVGAIAEGWRSAATFRREKAWSRNDERRQRLEQLYEALDQVSESYGHTVARLMLSLHTGKLEAGMAPDIKVPWSRLKMLVHFYFPEFSGLLARVEEAGLQGVGAAVGNAFQQISANERTRTAVGNSLFAATEKLDAALNFMRSAIVAECQKLDSSARRVTKR